MKQFFKFAFASAFGLIIAISILFFISIFGLMSVALYQTKSVVPIRSNSILHLNIGGELYERVEESPIDIVMSDYNVNKIGLNDLLSSIEAAAVDPRIEGIYIESDGLLSGLASIEELRNALTRFKESGKFVIVYGNVISQSEYFLTTVADSVYINPNGMLDFGGISLKQIFFKETLDKVGVDMQTVRVGTFKSAVEPFTLTKMSDANRLQSQSLANSLWNSIQEKISESRFISKDSLTFFADENQLFRPTEEYVGHGLIDQLLKRSEVETRLKEFSGLSSDEDLRLVSVRKMLAATSFTSSKSTIALLYAVGEIDGVTPNEGISSKKLCEEIKKLESDESVKGVVLRVNSPGGSAMGSEDILAALDELKQKKPVVVSMSDYAASGGYYISSNADYIFAHPTTITGSIGIFGLVPNVEGLSKKIGLAYDEVKTNKLSGFPSVTRPMSVSERSIMQASVQRGYDLFVRRCADGRSLDPDSIRAIGEGRVWSGAQALEIGLIDSLGGMSEAIVKAAELADLSDYQVLEYPRKRDWIQVLIADLTGDVESFAGKVLFGEKYSLIQQLRRFEQVKVLQARLPYDILINK